jgi:hypothetical protein
MRDMNLLGYVTDLLKDKEVTVRRSAAGCLGELLFYIASQESNPSNHSDKPWVIPPSIVQALTRSLKPKLEEDDVVQVYVSQTISNVSVYEITHRFSYVH